MATSLSPGNEAPFPSTAKWQAVTNLNMCKARNLVSNMLTKLRENEAAEAANKDAAMEQANREKEEAKSRVYKTMAAHEVVINTSFKCIQRIEDGILQAEDAMTKLTHERYKGFANLQVCERRQELREKRPKAENFKDMLTEALANERSVLEASRKELFALHEEGKKIVDDLGTMRAFLSRDTGERRLLMAHELTSLKPNLAPARPGDGNANGEASCPPSPTSTSLPPVASATPASPEKLAAPTQEEKKSDELIKATLSLLDRATSHRTRSLDGCAKAKQEAWRANHRTEDCLARRTAELSELKRQLEKSALDVDAAVTAAERSLDRTEKRCDPRDKTKSAKLASDKAVLAELRKTRLILQEDIRNKFAALEIDNMCRRVTPAKASEAKRMSRTSSAPNIRRKELGSTMSSMTTTDMGQTSSSMESSVKPGSPGGSRPLRVAGATTVQVQSVQQVPA